MDFLVFDEASTIFRKQYEQRENPDTLLDSLAKCREFGIGFLISTQSLSGLANTVIANCSTKIMIGGGGLGLDYEVFAAATAMTPEQKEFIKQFTRPGQACAKDPRLPSVFSLEVPKVVE